MPRILIEKVNDGESELDWRDDGESELDWSFVIQAVGSATRFKLYIGREPYESERPFLEVKFNRSALSNHLAQIQVGQSGKKLLSDVRKHVEQHLGEKLATAIEQLLLEPLGARVKEKTEFRQYLMKLDNVNVRIKLQHGGARARTRKKYDWTEKKWAAFVKRVDNLRPSWKSAIRFFEAQGYDPEALAMIRANRAFNVIPARLLKKAFDKRRRFSEEGTNVPCEYSPLALALEHASTELDIPAYKYNTLKNYYHRKKKS